ncbi:MAG: HAD-IIB family hydrolase [Pseudomonadota bacterium]
MSLLVFSDLDGTLLDHRTYSWEAAQPGLARLKALGAGLVLASSKTGAEIEPLREAMGFAHCPAIVENGAGILWPDEAQTPAAHGGSTDYDRIRALLATLPGGFRGFGDMDAGEVAERTGLSQDAATRAKERCFSEPGIWTGDDAGLTTFMDALAQYGLIAVRGGRFLTLSFGRTKATAMAEVINALQPSKTIALGDAPNDIAMIEAADQGVLIHNPSSPTIETLPSEKVGKTIRTKADGPAGWSEAILMLTGDPLDLSSNGQSDAC